MRCVACACRSANAADRRAESAASKAVRSRRAGPRSMEGGRTEAARRAEGWERGVVHGSGREGVRRGRDCLGGRE